MKKMMMMMMQKGYDIIYFRFLTLSSQCLKTQNQWPEAGAGAQPLQTWEDPRYFELPENINDIDQPQLFLPIPRAEDDDRMWLGL